VLGTSSRFAVYSGMVPGRLAGVWPLELAASRAIVMILSGLYLWWAADRSLAGVV